MSNIIYELFENINNSDYIVASYYLRLEKNVDPYEKAKSFAIGQSLGTWVKVPGITDEMRKKYMGKIVNIVEVPASDLVDDSILEYRDYIFSIAYPFDNFGPKFPMIMTTLLGNDASTSTQAKLIDIYMPKKFTDMFDGPNFGIEGLRKVTGVDDRPILLNMIKPCLGFKAEVGAEIFYQTALGGVDLIKDDELLANPSYCTLEDRLDKYIEASNRAYEKTGKKTLYVPNITDHVDKILDNAKMAVDKGAKLVMLNFASVGMDVLQYLTKNIDVPVIAHYASAGPYYESGFSGIASNLFLGKFARMAGADVVMINTPYGGYPLKKSRYLRTAHELMLDHPSYKKTMPCCGGGVNPGIVPTYINQLGKDIMLAAGGAVQGHPDGAESGVKAMIQSIESACQGIDLNEARKNHKELDKALEIWGIDDRL